MGIGEITKKIAIGTARVISNIGKSITSPNPKYVNYVPRQNIDITEALERQRMKEALMKSARAQMRKEKILRFKKKIGKLQSSLSTRFSRTFRSGTRMIKKVGRPRGPSGRYIIPGVGAVGVYQYRDWLKRQRRLDKLRMLQLKERLARVPPEIRNRIIQETMETEMPTEMPQITHTMPSTAPQMPVERISPPQPYPSTNNSLRKFLWGDWNWGIDGGGFL